ncbi:MAG: hypothetical protein V7641_4724 [Blastocatellia bacterium]
MIVIALVIISVGGETGYCQTKRPEGPETTVYKAQKKGRQDVVAVIDGNLVITEHEVDEAAGSQLYTLQEKIFSLRQSILKNLLIQTVLKEEAKRRGMTEGELRKQLMPDRVEVKQSDIDQAYADNLSVLENMNEDEAKQRIRLDLESRLKFDRYKAAVTEILSRAKIETFLSEPVPPASTINAEGPSKGPRDASVTIIEFSDFQCPYCKQAATNLKPLMQSYGSDVRFVFKQMPLPIHPDAFKAAQASVCAGEQGEFWEYHDILFSADDLSEQALKKYASDLGLPSDEFNSCLASEASATVVRRNMQEARQADVQGTPTFFVNGKIIRGLKSLEDFKNVIDHTLKSRQQELKRAPTQ